MIASHSPSNNTDANYNNLTPRASMWSDNSIQYYAKTVGHRYMSEQYSLHSQYTCNRAYAIL
eukprot:scaffold1688_cov226-Chaetoceros_neogracile.AAC.2